MATVVLTRPQGKNQALAADLQQHGIDTLLLPALSLTPTLSTLPASYRPADFDLLVFVSAQAAQYYLDALAVSGLAFMPNQRIATVGAASAQPFYQAGLADKVQLIHPPAAHPYQDSEALWALLTPHLDSVQRVLLVRGQQGREWLTEQLLLHNKTVERCCVYERVPALWFGSATQRLQDLLTTQPDTVTILLTSSESTYAIAENMVQLNLEPQWQNANFVAIHPRIAQALKDVTTSASLPFDLRITVCAPSQPAILKALLSVTKPD